MFLLTISPVVLWAPLGLLIAGPMVIGILAHRAIGGLKKRVEGLEQKKP